MDAARAGEVCLTVSLRNLEVLCWALAVIAASAVALSLVLVRGPGWAVLVVLALLAVGGALVAFSIAIRERMGAVARRSWLRAINDYLPDMLFDARPDGTIRAASNASEQLLGYHPELLRGRPVAAFTTEPLPDIDSIKGPPGTDLPMVWSTRWIQSNGDRVPMSTLLRVQRDATGRPLAIHGLVRDHRDRLATEEALRESEERFRRVLDTAQNGILLVSHDGRLVLTNDALSSLLGYRPEEMRLLSLSDIVHPVYLDQVSALMASQIWADAAPAHYEVALLGREGHRIEVEVSLAAFRESGRQTGALIEVRDLTEARRASETIRRMADYDALTGLPNRDLFDRHLQRAVIDARANEEHVAVILFDLDRFKVINDTLGHPSGDRLLKAVADRLSKRLPSRHILARFSGDEFLVLAPDLGGVPAAEGIAQRLLAAFQEPFDHDGHQIQVSATAGVAIYPVHASDGETLVRIADAAVHAGKAEGGNRFRLGSNDADDPGRRRLSLEADLRRRRGAQRVRGLLPTAGRPEHRGGDGPGGAAALAAGGARQCPAGRVHPAAGGDRPDRGRRRLGAASGLSRRADLARTRLQAAAGGGEPLAAPVPGLRPGTARAERPGRLRLGAVGAGTRTDRDHRHAEPGCGSGCAGTARRDWRDDSDR